MANSLSSERSTAGSRPKCSIDGCDKVTIARSWCSAHYQRWRHNGSPIAGSPSPLALKAIDHPDGTRTCCECEERKPMSAYHRDAAGQAGYRARCKKCRSVSVKAWYDSDPAARLDQRTGYREENRDLVRAQGTARYERSRPSRLELAKSGCHKRRARLALVKFDGKITVAGLRRRNGDRYIYCSVEISFEPMRSGEYNPLRATLEHILPINMTLACWQCNVRKNAKTVEEWTVGGQTLRQRTA